MSALVSNLIDSLAQPQMEPVHNVLLLGGLYFTTKTALKTLFTLYRGFKTFVLPALWPRNFVKEYGSWAVVTGCSKGIGLSYAHELAKRGMNLVLIARKAELLREIAKDITEKYGVEVEVIIADFGLATEATWADIEKGLAGKDIGILVNNVGVAYQGIRYFHEVSAASMQNMIQVNTTSMALMSRMVLPMMESKKKGAIINISSIAGLAPSPYMSLYSGTKSFVDFFSRALAYEYDDKGIIVQCVYPGPVETDMLNAIIKEGEPRLPGLFPNADSYAAQAVRTLGFASCTTGYWSHGLLTLSGILNCTWLSKQGNKKQLISSKDK